MEKIAQTCLTQFPFQQVKKNTRQFPDTIKTFTSVYFLFCPLGCVICKDQTRGKVVHWNKAIVMLSPEALLQHSAAAFTSCIVALQGTEPHSQKYIPILKRTASSPASLLLYDGKTSYSSFFSQGDLKLSKESQICPCCHLYYHCCKSRAQTGTTSSFPYQPITSPLCSC